MNLTKQSIQYIYSCVKLAHGYILKITTMLTVIWHQGFYLLSILRLTGAVFSIIKLRPTVGLLSFVTGNAASVRRTILSE